MKRNWKIPCLLAATVLAFAGSGCNGASRSAPPSVEPAPTPVDPTEAAFDLAAAPETGERTEPLTIENAAYAEAAEYSARHGGLALAVIEGVARLLPGVVGNPESVQTESFRGGLLEEPQYTRPANFHGWTVPEVLLSGDHAKIAAWREDQRQQSTRERRPDLS